MLQRMSIFVYKVIINLLIIPASHYDSNTHTA